MATVALLHTSIGPIAIHPLSTTALFVTGGEDGSIQVGGDLIDFNIHMRRGDGGFSAPEELLDCSVHRRKRRAAISSPPTATQMTRVLRVVTIAVNDWAGDHPWTLQAAEREALIGRREDLTREAEQMEAQLASLRGRIATMTDQISSLE